MSKPELVRHVARFLRLSASSPSGNARHSPPAGTLKAMLAAHPSVMVGNLHSLNLVSLIQQRFSDPKATLRRAHDIAVSVIEENLRPQDRWERSDNHSYLLYFPGLLPEACALKASVIAEQICRRLRETEAKLSDVDYRMKMKVFRRDPAAKASAGAGASPLSAPQLREFQELKDWSSRALQMMCRNGAVGYDEFSAYSFLGDEREGGTLEDGGTLDYSPVWYVPHKTVTAYLCRAPTPGPTPGNGETPAPSEGTDLGLMTPRRDIEILCRARLDWQQWHEAERRGLVIVPLSLSTMTDRRSRALYLAAANDMSDLERRRIVFELSDVSDTVPSYRMLEFISALKRYGRAVLARVPPRFEAFERLRNLGLHGIGLDLGQGMRSEKQALKALERFARRARLLSLRTYGVNVPSRSLFVASVCNGFDYLEGPLVTWPGVEPGDVYRFGEKDMYADLLGGNAEPTRLTAQRASSQPAERREVARVVAA